MSSIQKIVVLSGAGISAESGISTFRDAGGLWEKHDIMEVASFEGWKRNRDLVLRFYNDRRRQLKDVEPNAAHFALAQLESQYEVNIVTQNVDDLHERAGSSQVLHLHGELRKVRSTLDENLVYPWTEDLNPGDKCERGSQLRPHIVWFGEMVPLIPVAAKLVQAADLVMIVGTSMQVYPAAGLVNYAARASKLYYIDPHPAAEANAYHNLEIMAEKASVAVPKLVHELLKRA
jgi:NAD-dependent deacetylase